MFQSTAWNSFCWHVSCTTLHHHHHAIPSAPVQRRCHDSVQMSKFRVVPKFRCEIKITFPQKFKLTSASWEFNGDDNGCLSLAYHWQHRIHGSLALPNFCCYKNVELPRRKCRQRHTCASLWTSLTCCLWVQLGWCTGAQPTTQPPLLQINILFRL